MSSPDEVIINEWKYKEYIRRLESDYAKVNLEYHSIRRQLSACDGKRRFLESRCFSYRNGKCAADKYRNCVVQCYSIEKEFLNERTSKEKLVRVKE